MASCQPATVSALGEAENSLGDRTPRMPTWFIPHGGGPCFFMEWSPKDEWAGMAKFLRDLPSTLPAAPSALLVISAHWQEPEATVLAAAAPNLLYDYYGFPPSTYELTYPARGQPELADRVSSMLAAAGLGGAKELKRGWDHGVFIPLKVAFPDARIPVVQVSLRNDLDAAGHVRLGRALAPLREEGVLIIGSGMSFHNMAGFNDPRYGSISDQFDKWLTAAVESSAAERDEALANWERAPHARHVHPPRAEEHLLPLMVAAGAAGEDQGKHVYGEHVMGTQVSGYVFGAK